MGIPHFSLKFINTRNLAYFARNVPFFMLYFVCNEYLLFVHYSVFNEILHLLNADI